MPGVDFSGSAAQRVVTVRSRSRESGELMTVPLEGDRDSAARARIATARFWKSAKAPKTSKKRAYRHTHLHTFSR